MEEDKTLDVKEAAAFLRIHEDTLYMMVKRRQIPHFRLGIRIFFKLSALNGWIELQIQNSMVPQVVDQLAGSLRQVR